MFKKVFLIILIVLLSTLSVTAAQTKLIPIPIVFSSPETGFGLGGMGVYFKDTKTSEFRSRFGGFYTTENQANLFLTTEKSSNGWKYSGSLSYQDWVKNFYGLDNQISFAEGIEYDSQGFSLEGGVSKEIIDNHFLGVISNYESYDLNLGHQINQSFRGINGVDLFGLGIKYNYDTRDRVMNTRQGQYLVYQAVAYNQDFSNYQCLIHELDYRKFKELKPGHVLALQSKLELSNGEIPLQKLSSLGNMNILRGFEEDKFTSENKVVTQIEYRYPIYKQWTGTVFAGLGEVFQDFEVDELKKSWGLGLRYNLDKERGVNLRIDLAFNSGEGSFYLSVGEAF